MKKYFRHFILYATCLTCACSNTTNSSKDIEKSPQNHETSVVSVEDQRIIDKYDSYFEYYREGNFEEFQKKMSEILPEIGKIQNKSKRELMQMNIYMTLQMNEEAYALNEQQLKERPNNPARLTFRCQLLELQDKERNLIHKCFDHAAEALKVELEKPELKSSPNYKLAEFSYLLTKYKAGHFEYKEKMQKHIEDTKDENLKITLKNVYSVEVEN